jgi:ComF family protein
MLFAELGSLARQAEQWLLPGECLQCQGAVGSGDPLICPTCQSRWRSLPEPQCVRCGQPTSKVADTCRICAAWPEEFTRARSAVWLDDAARAAVHHLKYGGWWRVAVPMARLLNRLDPASGPGVLVPIPLARRRMRLRGYNQAERLAWALSACSGLPSRPDLLSRSRETPTQTTLPPEARRANVAEAFACGDIPDGARVVLVDDVFTTGATLAEAAATLLEAGAGTVESVTFARARPPVH